MKICSRILNTKEQTSCNNSICNQKLFVVTIWCYNLNQLMVMMTVSSCRHWWTKVSYLIGDELMEHQSNLRIDICSLVNMKSKRLNVSRNTKLSLNWTESFLLINHKAHVISHHQANMGVHNEHTICRIGFDQNTRIAVTLKFLESWCLCWYRSRLKQTNKLLMNWMKSNKIFNLRSLPYVQ